MMITNLIPLCLFLTICSCELIISRITRMTDMDDLRPANNSSVVISTSSVLQCAIQCSNIISCKSLSHHSDKGTCLLHFFLFNDTEGAIDEDGWESYGERCATKPGYVHNETLDWCYRLERGTTMTASEAINFCRLEGARMSRINSPERNVHVTDLLYSLGIPSLWIGGCSRNRDNNFTYEDGTPLSYFNWGESYPRGNVYIRLVNTESNIFFWENGMGTAYRNVMCELIW